MANIATNAGKLGRAYAGYARRFRNATRAGMRRVLLTVEKKAVANLSGSGEPGAFPIPVVTGDLRRSMRVRLVSDTQGIVSNTSIHAAEQERGFHPYGNENATPIPPRPFLSKAAKDTNVMGEFRTGFRASLFGGAR